ncbi:leucine-rich repeat domain-containing protein, partial [Helicobacter ganmani]|uniref:leucine-rich repeat domain-containing protein n=1 Tax=Helicobacter ganmani TaxID=60246 RepID=UPI003A883BF0
MHHAEVEAGNAVYASVGGKCIIGKSDIRNEDYDTLVLFALGTVEAAIPGTIKIIGPYAFACAKLASIEIPSHVTQICEGAFFDCRQLARVEFAPNSEFRTIGKNAFSYTKLASIEIPSHVTQIGEGAFCYCKQLARVEFAPNSELRTIGGGAFASSALASIKIPASVVELKDGWCYMTDELHHAEVEAGNAVYASVGGKCIIGKSDIRNEDYDTLVFLARDTVEATIPGTIKIIGSHAFSRTKLASIEIPSHVTQICEGAFYYCGQLARVEFAPNSELRTIGKNAFSYTKLASIEIP